MKTQCLFVTALALASGCSGKTPKAKILVPDAATLATDYRGDGSAPTQRYVVRMSDGYRDWEVEFPEVATGYEMRIPLKGGGEPPEPAALAADTEVLTGADMRLLGRLRRERGKMEREGVFIDGEHVLDAAPASSGAEDDAVSSDEGATRDESAAAITRPSYLLGIDELNSLYRTGNYELALVKLTRLSRAYPDDVKLLSMEGTLWLKIGRADIAREVWEKVLQIDPRNRGVIRALKRLED